MRPAVVAGSFYPAEKTKLKKQIKTFLNQAKRIKEKDIRILIVPHAGYKFSGPTAAWGYKQLTRYKSVPDLKIILLGCSHQAYFAGAALYHAGSWQTPLGKVEIDEKLASALIKQSKLTEANLEAHEQEHSLEVQLPFLQVVLSDFKIIPILLGQTNNQKDLAQTIAKNFDNRCLLVISSDLSHYPSYEVASKVDKQTIKAILGGKVEEFEKVISQNVKYPKADTLACGAEAIKTGMMVAKILSLKPPKLLHYSNSGDFGGTKSQVVGYASIGFYGKVK